MEKDNTELMNISENDILEMIPLLLTNIGNITHIINNTIPHIILSKARIYYKSYYTNNKYAYKNFNYFIIMLCFAI